MISKQQLLRDQVIKFFEDESHTRILFQCVKSSNPISLRLLDWFVTTYCKVNSNRIASEIGVDIYNSYKGQLKSYNKIFFDPFCRNNNKTKNNKSSYINMEYDNISFNTSLGQLNFFRWVINTNIIPYIQKNIVYLKQQSRLKARCRNPNINNPEVCLLEKEKKYYYSVSF